MKYVLKPQASLGAGSQGRIAMLDTEAIDWREEKQQNQVGSQEPWEHKQ